MSSQPEINIGLVGHVDHGKTTLTERFTGKWTDTHSEEMKRGITIRLGYANTEFREIPGKKGTEKYTVSKKVKGKETKLLRKVSFVDAPGHESLMATMLSGAKIMDGALLLVAANEKCPQPQTAEHLMALEISGIKNVVIVQNKIDLIPEDKVLKNYEQIKKFLKGTSYEKSPIIPISAQHGVNMDLLIEHIENQIPTPKRDEKANPQMIIARSFDINKPGTKIKNLQGGVLGGAVLQGKIKEGDTIEIRPGRITEEQNKTVAKPIITKVVSLMTGNEKVKSVMPGGSVALLTELDPGVVKSDALAGSLVGHKEKLPNVLNELTLDVKLLERVVGSKEELKVDPLKTNEILMLTVNSAATVGITKEISKNKIKCSLKKPICASKGDRVTMSRRIGTRFRLIGYGIIS